jgi:hypothetical protein
MCALLRCDRWCAEFGESEEMRKEWSELADQTAKEAALAKAVATTGEDLRAHTSVYAETSEHTSVSHATGTTAHKQRQQKHGQGVQEIPDDGQSKLKQEVAKNTAVSLSEEIPYDGQSKLQQEVAKDTPVSLSVDSSAQSLTSRLWPAAVYSREPSKVAAAAGQTAQATESCTDVAAAADVEQDVEDGDTDENPWIQKRQARGAKANRWNK